MATFTSVTDIWTQGYDQFYRPCWQNNKTREIYYESSGQVPAQHYVSFGYAATPNLPAGPDFTAAVGSRLEGFPLWQATLPPLIGKAQGIETRGVGDFTTAADMRTYGFDQFNRPCWQNNKTREIYYESSGQVPAQHYVSFGYAANPNLPAGPDFTAAGGSRLEGFPLWQATLPPLIGKAQGIETRGVGDFTTAADMRTYGFDQFNRPCWLNEKTRELHYDSVEGQPPAQPPRRLFTPTGPSPQSGPYFLPLVSSRAEDIPPPKAWGNTRVDEDGQWYLQRNKKGEEYYLNTTTWQWQFETPDCLKKSARGKWLPGYYSSKKG